MIQQPNDHNNHEFFNQADMDIRTGYGWYWQHSSPKLSSLMTDHLLGDILLPDVYHSYTLGHPFYHGWSQAQTERKSLNRLRPPGSFCSYGELNRHPFATLPRCSHIFQGEEEGRMRLLIPSLIGPYEIPLPYGAREASPSERAVLIAVAEMTVGHGCTSSCAPHFYLHMVTGLPSLKATTRAVEGALSKGCIRREDTTLSGKNPTYSLTNVNDYAATLKLQDMEREEMQHRGLWSGTDSRVQSPKR